MVVLVVERLERAIVVVLLFLRAVDRGRLTKYDMGAKTVMKRV